MEEERKRENKLEDSLQRTEEVQDIIERMPNRFGKVISIIVLIIVCLMLLFGWLVRYPDIVTGQININASQAPLKIIAMHAGKLQLSSGLRSQDHVTEGQLIAWLENPATPVDVFKLICLMDSLVLPTKEALTLYNRLPRNVVLGELTPKYFTFLNSLKQLADYQSNRLYDKQKVALKNLLEQQQKVLTAAINKADINQENLELVSRFSARDSILFIRKVLSAADMDRSKLNSIGAEDQYQATIRDVANSREQISRTESQLQELDIQQAEKEQQLNLDLLTSYNDFRDNLTSWEQRYVFTAPFEGQVQFLNFWNNDQFVQAGEAVFTVVPKQEEIIGQVILPANGAGKVNPRQEVIVKLDDYPYLEYGSVTGYVEDISLTTNTLQNGQGEIDNYLISISFPNQLTTNYGSQLDFRYGIKGTAEIVTNDRRLIQRFFDNLKYIVKK